MTFFIKVIVGYFLKKRGLKKRLSFTKLTNFCGMIEYRW